MGYEFNGLYYFGDPLTSSVLPSDLQASTPPVLESSVLDSSIFSLKTLDLWHARLGHANF